MKDLGLGSILNTHDELEGKSKNRVLTDLLRNGKGEGDNFLGICRINSIQVQERTRNISSDKFKNYIGK